MDISQHLTDAQKRAVSTARTAFNVASHEETVKSHLLTQGIQGLLYELDKGAQGGYVSPAYLREKFGQIMEVVEAEEGAPFIH